MSDSNSNFSIYTDEFGDVFCAPYGEETGPQYMLSEDASLQDGPQGPYIGAPYEAKVAIVHREGSDDPEEIALNGRSFVEAFGVTPRLVVYSLDDRDPCEVCV